MLSVQRPRPRRPPLRHNRLPLLLNPPTLERRVDAEDDYVAAAAPHAQSNNIFTAIRDSSTPTERESFFCSSPVAVLRQQYGTLQRMLSHLAIDQQDADIILFVCRATLECLWTTHQRWYADVSTITCMTIEQALREAAQQTLFFF